MKESTFSRYFRYIRYFLWWLFVEKIHGLDFSMRSRRIGITAKGSSGYGLTPKKTLEKIFSKLHITNEDSFIDIGCGKGFVLWKASKLKFNKVDGIEVEKFLVNIARKNFKKLGLDKRIKIVNTDATKFTRYNDYNFYYLFDPFSLEIQKKVLELIFEAVRERGPNHPSYIICYNMDTSTAIIKDSNLFQLSESFADDVKKGSPISIWTSINPPRGN